MHSKIKKIVISMIIFYQKNISCLKRPCCRFTPTCSEYAKIAVNRFGVIKGLLMALFRVLRCNPLCKYGYDPVPNSKKKR